MLQDSTGSFDLATLGNEQLQALIEQAQAILTHRQNVQVAGRTAEFSDIRIVARGNSIDVISPYHPDFVKLARQLNGKFGAGPWTFDARDEARIRDLLRSIYGTDGSGPIEVADVQAIITGTNGGDNVLFALGREIASRRERDARVRLGNGVTIVDGGFPGSCGSTKYPRLVSSGPVIVLVRDVPLALAQAAVESDNGVYSIVG